MARPLPLIAVLSLLLAACTGHHDNDRARPGATPVPADASTAMSPNRPTSTGRPVHALTAATPSHFASDAYGFAITYPADLRATRQFKRSYLADERWKAYADPDSKGSPVLALVLPGSNHITAGELRIGASRDPDALERCSRPPQAMHGEVGRRTVHGIDFTYFEAGDAAMSHYMDTHSYRIVHHGACIAIDLLVTGTRAEVYDPPATPPFARAQAFARLHAALEGFRMTSPSTGGVGSAD